MPHPTIHLIPHDLRVRKPEYVFVKGRLPKDIGVSEDQVRVYGVDVTGDEYCYIDHPDAAKLISDWRKRQRTAMEADMRQKAVCRPWQSVVPLALASDSSSSQHVSEAAAPAAANASPVQSNFNHFGLWQQPTYCAGNVASVSNTASAAAAAASAAADVADMPAASTTTANTTATAVAPGSMVGVKRRLFDSDDTKDDADLNLTHLEASGDLLELPLAKRARLIGLGGAAGAAGAAAAGTLSDDDSESYLARVTSLQR